MQIPLKSPQRLRPCPRIPPPFRENKLTLSGNGPLVRCFNALSPSSSAIYCFRGLYLCHLTIGARCEKQYLILRPFRLSLCREEEASVLYTLRRRRLSQPTSTPTPRHSLSQRPAWKCHFCSASNATYQLSRLKKLVISRIQVLW